MKQSEIDRLVLSETLKAVKSILGESERDAQKETAKKVADLKSEAEDQSEKEEKKPAVSPENTKKELVDVTLDKVVDKLNMMRSGKSANSKDVKDNLDTYFKSLNMGERQSLYVFLDALNQILTGGVDGKKAPEPDEQGIDTDPVRASVKPKEKGSDDSIIVVGEAQDLSEIKNLLKELSGQA